MGGTGHAQNRCTINAGNQIPTHTYKMMMSRAFRFALSTLGLSSAALGLLAMLPRVSARTWMTQMALSEFPGVPALLGGAVGAAGWKFKSPVAFTLGTLGSLMSLLPVLNVRSAVANMNREMRGALGRNYETAIQPHALNACQPYRWSLRRTFTAHRLAQYPVVVERDVVYCERPTRPLKLDVYRPTAALRDAANDGGSSLLPAVIVLHPGAWSSGDKSWVFTPHDMTLAAKGYVVFDIQYRFVDETQWPGQLDDCRAAVRWVRAHAAEYGVDPNRIALLGRSSGGHIALSTAYQAHGEHADTRVNAVVGIYAPSNLAMVGEKVDPRIARLMGGDLNEQPNRYYDASPLNHVSPEAPPTLLIHGQKDGLLYSINSEVLRWALRRAGVPVALLRVPWAHHAFDGAPGGLGAQLTTYDLDRFLAWSLYHER